MRPVIIKCYSCPLKDYGLEPRQEASGEGKGWFGISSKVELQDVEDEA